MKNKDKIILIGSGMGISALTDRLGAKEIVVVDDQQEKNNEIFAAPPTPYSAMKNMAKWDTAPYDGDGKRNPKFTAKKKKRKKK